MRPKDVTHAGKTHNSPIPKAAMFLMRTEDRGREDDADPTDGGQVDDIAEAGMEGPDLVTQVRDLMSQYGPEQFTAAVEACMAEMQPDQSEQMDEQNQASITA
jgi:hypothetical protein